MAMQAAETTMVSEQMSLRYFLDSGNSPDPIDMKETWRKVLGRDRRMPINITIIEKTTVHCE